MINIRVVSFNGEPPVQTLSFAFDERGGTLGRAETNQLVLPDPDRHVSRVQARVLWSSDHFELMNIGANALDLGGRSVVNGNCMRIRPGDRIGIGGYVLEVCAVSDKQPPAAEETFGLFSSNAPAARLRPPAPELTEPYEAASQIRPGDNPLGLSQSGGRAPAGRIPHDFDLFSDPLTPRPKEGWDEAGSLEALGFGREGEASAESNINALFGLGPAGSGRGSEADLFAGTPLGDAPQVGSGGRPVDPLAAFSGVPPAAPAAAPVPDQVAEIHGAYKPPAPVIQGDTFYSWDNGASNEKADSTAVRSIGEDGAAGSGGAPESLRVRPSPPPLVSPSPPAVNPSEDLDIVSRMVAVPVARAIDANKGGGEASGAGTRSATSTEERVPDAQAIDALTRAFLSGLGVPDLPLPGAMTPELLERIGMLLRESTQGTLDLLLARATTKREVRAEMTMIVSHDNNPLKFSPNVEIALTHLLAPRGRGFMPPVDAMRDAYQDLRAHELGFIAGMRAALAGVLRRFDPAVLEQRLSDKSLLDTLLPTNRRARLWDQYTELYRDIASEAEDGFHALFGREFVRAYEEQVRQQERRDT